VFGSDKCSSYDKTAEITAVPISSSAWAATAGYDCKNSIGLNGKFLRFRRDDVSKPRSFYKAGVEKLVARWETVIVSNGNYIID
jgi:hypothetical protein